MSTTAPVPSVATAAHPQTRRGRGGPRRGPRNPQSQQHASQRPEHTVQGGRQFGGRLTQNLNADAPDFVPKSSPQAPAPTKPPPKARRRGSLAKSTAPDIATRTHDDIAHGVYECAICTNEISRNSKVWSCKTCWTVFHIGCIKKWSRNEGSAFAGQAQSDGETPAPRQWRCPGCNLPKDVLPNVYTCWCEKEQDPKMIPGLPPHSCGQSCGKARPLPKACPHPCDLICHAGPCPPCTHMGPSQSCFCGKEVASRRCMDTDYSSGGWSCGKICEDIMPCGEHTCQRPCHEGFCGACEEMIDARCYCGKEHRSILCSAKDEERESDGWVGVFDCGQTCGRPLDCGVHFCEQQCHPQDAQSATPHCPRSPDMITHCPCGKTPLSELSKTPRESCADAIPSCDKPCNKPLACGHPCKQICHSGACMPCLLTVSIKCRCGRNSFNTICHQGTEEPPHCMRVCKALLNCGRHDCGERCCPGEKKAMERQATRKKLKPLGAAARVFDNDIEAEHICTRVCGRPLKCGNHDCPDLCHKGPCGSCKEAIFEEISCNCGRTVLQPPLPCGTQPPICRFPCQRQKQCGHPQTTHTCHEDTEACPKCPFLVEKDCMCGKKTLKNQPCWLNDVRCGQVCGKRLKCGSHYCQKLCHRSGECEDAGTPCQQPCGKSKKACGHPCEKPCHAPSACKEDKPCPFKVINTCECQRRKEESKCNARAGVPSSSNTLKCDEECARLERNRKLALALSISDTHTDDHIPYSSTTLSMYQEDPKWSQQQEEALRIFAADDQERRLRFKPMKPHQRAFIHALGEDFGFDSESVDPEPHRHVLLFKTPKFVAAPMKTIVQALRIQRLNSLQTTTPASKSANEVPREPAAQNNGLLLLSPRFALTMDELRPHVAHAAPQAHLDIKFLPDGSVAMILSDPTPSVLSNLKSALDTHLIKKEALAGAIQLCVIDDTSPDWKVLSVQSGNASEAGWSQVAAKSAAAARAPVQKAVGERPVYTVLGSRLAEAKRKKELEEKLKKDVVDDWEVEAERDVDGDLERKGEAYD